VRLLTIDSLDLPRARLLKIDVNGMELDVINGAQRTLDELQPVLYIANTRDARALEVVRVLDGLGYSLFWSISPCFNEDNFFREPRNVFHQFCAHVNMIGVHRSSDVNIVGDTDRVPVPPPGATDARAVFGTMFDFLDSRGDGLGVLDNDDLFGAASATAPAAGMRGADGVAEVEAAAARALRDVLGDDDDDDDLDALLGATLKPQDKPQAKQQPKPQPPPAPKSASKPAATAAPPDRPAARPAAKPAPKPAAAVTDDLDAILGTDDDEEDFDSWLDRIKQSLGV
jgi:hypothetical protein